MSLKYSGWVLAKFFVHFLAMYLQCTGSGHHPLPPVLSRLIISIPRVLSSRRLLPLSPCLSRSLPLSCWILAPATRTTLPRSYLSHRWLLLGRLHLLHRLPISFRLFVSTRCSLSLLRHLPLSPIISCASSPSFYSASLSSSCPLMTSSSSSSSHFSALLDLYASADSSSSLSLLSSPTASSSLASTSSLSSPIQFSNPLDSAFSSASSASFASSLSLLV
jgi:hypothetical protein